LKEDMIWQASTSKMSLEQLSRANHQFSVESREANSQSWRG